MLAHWLAMAQTESISWNGIGTPARYWVDPSGTATPEVARSMLAPGMGLPADPARVMPLGDGRAVWFRLELPAVAAPVRAVVTVPHSGMDAADMFLWTEAGGFEQLRSGDRVPVRQWTIRHLHPVFGLALSPRSNQEVYLRVQHSQPVGVPWRFWDVRSFNEANKISHMFLGAYVGFAVLVILLSFTNAFTWRDPIHLYFAGNVTLVGLTQLSLTGLAGEYFWPDNAWWNDIAAVTLPTLAMASSSWLVRELVSERGLRALPAALLAYSCAGLAIAVGFVTVGRVPFFLLLNLYLVAGIVLLIGSLAWFTLRRPRVGGWVLAGFTILMLSALYPLLRNFEILPTTFATQYATIIASAIDPPLVLTGLYFRSRERRDNRMRLAAMSHTDPLTGVGSHAVLMDRLAGMLRKQSREAAEGAVLRVRVRNAAAIQHGHGTEAGQAALVRAAECVAMQAREGDTVARHKGGDFVLLLMGSVVRDDLAAAARNIIARGLKFSGRLPPGVTLQFQVAAARAPFTAATADELLQLLDEALQDGEARPFRTLRTASEEEASAPPLGT